MATRQQSSPRSTPSAQAANRYMVPALERGLRLLEQFDRDTRVLTAPELAHRLELPRSTVFRLLATLENLGFVAREEGGREYRLGLGILRLGFEYLASLPLTELGQPLLEELSETSGHPCNLIVRDGRSIVYVARVAPPSPFVSAVSVGTRLPAHATVLGRILLSDLNLNELNALYPEPELREYAPSTPRTTEALFELLQGDKKRGYAVSEGFYEANISTIAAPVHGENQRVIAALGMTINAGRIDDAERKPMIELVCGSATRLSRLMNYTPPNRHDGGSQP